MIYHLRAWWLTKTIHHEMLEFIRQRYSSSLAFSKATMHSFSVQRRYTGKARHQYVKKLEL